MNIYLDEDSSAAVLIAVLRRANHDVQSAADQGQLSHKDPEIFRRAVILGRVLLSHNHDDFEDLHDLILTSGGHHPGILIVRKDNDPSRDLSARGIAVAIEKLIQSGMRIDDGFHTLNQWR
jgi:predicted nuclease of predicted toxin-antitoxin system